MSWHNFIFSEKTSDRFRRHGIFWLVWWIYFTATYYYYVQVGLQKITFGSFSGIVILKTFILLLIHISSCYAFIYFILPRYVLKRKYFSFSVSLILLTGLLLISGYYTHAILFPIIDNAYQFNFSTDNNMLWWTSINSGLLNAPKIIAAATAIKLVKRWYLKQKEKERIEKEKLTTDLQLLKAQMRPDFLFSSLEQIYRYTEKKSPKAPELLVKFSDLLSYMLYECEDIKVSLEKELMMTKEYLLLEKMRYDDSIEIEIGIRGDLSSKEIAPLILLPFIENSFRQSHSVVEQPWINLDINIENEMLTMKLMNGISSTFINDGNEIKTTEIKNVEKRLDVLYENNYELKMHADQEIFITMLKINLKKKAFLATNISVADFKNQQLISKYAVN